MNSIDCKLISVHNNYNDQIINLKISNSKSCTYISTQLWNTMHIVCTTIHSKIFFSSAHNNTKATINQTIIIEKAGIHNCTPARNRTWILEFIPRALTKANSHIDRIGNLKISDSVSSQYKQFHPTLLIFL